MKQHRNVRRHGFLGLLRRHPAASVLTLWVGLLLLAGLSTATLVHTEVEAKMPPPPEEPAPSQMVMSQHSVASLEGNQDPISPLLSFGAIALSCALGCLLLSRTARPAPYLIRYKEPEPAALPPPVAPDTIADESESPKSVTIIPKQQNHPLDWDEPSLADSLDLRQRRPLSHWL
jgi:hypothetical protein